MCVCVCVQNMADRAKFSDDDDDDDDDEPALCSFSSSPSADCSPGQDDLGRAAGIHP